MTDAFIYTDPALDGPRLWVNPKRSAKLKAKYRPAA